MVNREANQPFSFIVVPDTQKLAVHHPDIYRKMARSIQTHAEERGTRAVFHLGDVVDNGGDDELQYIHASEALSAIDEAGIPLLVAPGNHDYDKPIVSSSGLVTSHHRRGLVMFNRYFGVNRFHNKRWFGGAFERGKAENVYALLESGGLRMLVLILEFVPRREVMLWADQMMREHSDRQAIVITHSYMNMHGERVKAGDKANPKTKYFAAGVECHDGEEMWQQYLKHHPGLLAVFSGHHIPIATSHRIDEGVHGNMVIQLFQNWQEEELGGCGRYRVVEYDPERKVMTMRVFNPLAEQFEKGPGYEISCQVG